MSYKASISTSNPQAILILVDQSGSMSETIEWRGNTTTKAGALCEVINSTLAELAARCNHYGEYRHFFDIAVYGYSGRGVYSMLGAHNTFVAPAYLSSAAVRTVDVTNVRNLPDSRQVTTHYKQKIWVEPLAEGDTPMCAAFQKAFDLLASWIVSRQNKVCFPPLVINITDGEVTDSTHDELRGVAEKLRSMKTLDGNTLLLNVHISNNSKTTILFPNESQRPTGDTMAELLFEMSSTMPLLFESEISSLTSKPGPYRGFAFNASMADLMRMLNLSSSTAQLTH